MPASKLASERTTASPAATRTLLARLPAAERDAISLARVEHLTYREVAVALGISEDTAKRRIRSGLRRMRAEMQRPGSIAS